MLSFCQLQKFPDMLVGVAIVFPVVFSIGSAYNRRVSQRYNAWQILAMLFQFIIMPRDWTTDKEMNCWCVCVRHNEMTLFNATNVFLLQTVDALFQVQNDLQAFSKLLWNFEIMVQSGEISRVNNTSKMTLPSII